ncbi:MAG: ATPase, T2SS/T4P/T4SS family, partial [Anaerolineales bacterium]
MSLLRRLEQGQKPAATNGDAEARAKLAAAQVRRVAPPALASVGTYYDLKSRVQNRLLAELDPNVDINKVENVRNTIQDLFDQILAEENIVLSRPERVRLFEQIAAEILGFGPLQALLEDDKITEIMVNGAKNIYVERDGKLHRVPITFESDDHVMRIIDRIVSPMGRRIDESSPYVDARLPDGSRVNAVIPPISLVGPTITIRKFFKNPLTIEQLIEFGTITPEAVQFL